MTSSYGGNTDKNTLLFTKIFIIINFEVIPMKMCCLNPIKYGVGVFKTQFAFDALLDPLGVQLILFDIS